MSRLVYGIAVAGAFFGTLIGAESAKASPLARCQTTVTNHGTLSYTVCVYNDGTATDTTCYAETGDCFTTSH